MKNKKITYSLFGVVILIWGILIYKFVAAVGGNDDSVVTMQSFVSSEEIEVLKKDSFHLRNAYRDPFFGKVYVEGKTKKNYRAKPKKKLVKVEKQEEIIDWAFVRYFGEIKSHDGVKKTALLQLWGADRMVKENEIIDDFQLLKIGTDSIQISFKNKKKYIKRK